MLPGTHNIVTLLFWVWSSPVRVLGHWVPVWLPYNWWALQQCTVRLISQFHLIIWFIAHEHRCQHVNCLMTGSALCRGICSAACGCKHTDVNANACKLLGHQLHKVVAVLCTTVRTQSIYTFVKYHYIGPHITSNCTWPPDLNDNNHTITAHAEWASETFTGQHSWNAVGSQGMYVTNEDKCLEYKLNYGILLCASLLEA